VGRRGSLLPEPEALPILWLRRRSPAHHLQSRVIKRSDAMLKFLGTTMGIIFLIGLLVVVGLIALIF
jgi:hypothetical protein